MPSLRMYIRVRPARESSPRLRKTRRRFVEKRYKLPFRFRRVAARGEQPRLLSTGHTHSLPLANTTFVFRVYSDRRTAAVSDLEKLATCERRCRAAVVRVT